MTLAERYVAGVPSDQNAINLFAGEWSSRFPSNRPDLAGGAVTLYEDERVNWANGELGGLAGKHVLELGPLEAGHSYMAEKLGAASVLAIEANSRAYLKCLIAKEIFGLTRVQFLLGDFVEYLRATPPNPRFDVCFASGVLYHMRDPLGLLENIARYADAVFLWSHYNDPSILDPKPDTAHRFGEMTSVTRFGRSFELREFVYQEAVRWGGFCGGNADSSYWMKRDDILEALRLVGFKRLTVGIEQADHPNGPAFCVVGTR
jgi:SAM-dependent methyltransferase